MNTTPRATSQQFAGWPRIRWPSLASRLMKDCRAARGRLPASVLVAVLPVFPLTVHLRWSLASLLHGLWQRCRRQQQRGWSPLLRQLVRCPPLLLFRSPDCESLRRLRQSGLGRVFSLRLRFCQPRSIKARNGASKVLLAATLTSALFLRPVCTPRPTRDSPH